MTREEAKGNLIHAFRWNDMPEKEALEMAIKALEQEPCEDCISRQAVNILVDELARAISDERCCISRGRSTATIMQDILDLPPVTPQMMGQWQELKETIIEMRDNDGTGTQQEVCKFLANLMGVLEKQMQEPCEDAIDRAEAMTEIMMFAGNVKSDEEDIYIKVSDAVQLLRELPPVNLQPKTGHWIDIDDIESECSECGHREPNERFIFEDINYCAKCGAKMVETQESEDKE